MRGKHLVYEVSFTFGLLLDGDDQLVSEVSGQLHLQRLEEKAPSMDGFAYRVVATVNRISGILRNVKPGSIKTDQWYRLKLKQATILIFVTGRVDLDLAFVVAGTELWDSLIRDAEATWVDDEPTEAMRRQIKALEQRVAALEGKAVY